MSNLTRCGKKPFNDFHCYSSEASLLPEKGPWKYVCTWMNECMQTFYLMITSKHPEKEKKIIIKRDVNAFGAQIEAKTLLKNMTNRPKLLHIFLRLLPPLFSLFFDNIFLESREQVPASTSIFLVCSKTTIETSYAGHFQTNKHFLFTRGNAQISNTKISGVFSSRQANKNSPCWFRHSF